MTVVGIDDTDSRERGMCTTYLAADIAAQLRERGAMVERCLLVRLNPAIEHKTRGNAAVAIHTDAAPDVAFDLARSAVEAAARTADPTTNPGLVVAPSPPAAVPDAVADFAASTVRDRVSIEAATDLIGASGYDAAGWGIGRGRIGALAAVGAWAAFGEWTYEHIAYREPARRGTPREVDRESVFAAADAAYPAAWDTVDRTAGEAVCVPNTPGPVLFGIRGEDPDTVTSVADAIEHEPIERSQRFVTNQGTDAHLRPGTIGGVSDGKAYRVTGTVTVPPATHEGGHVFFELGDEAASLRCVAFEPTKRFRDHVRRLRAGDRITACGEVADGTLKLEKFAVRELVETETVTPDCPACGRSMSSAGAGQGYRCRDCGRHADGKVDRPIDRTLERGWYEVPPRARRHIAKPLVRGGFDARTHPER